MHQNSKQTINKNVFFFLYSNGVTDSSSSSTEENNNKITDHQPSQFTCDFCSKFFKRSQSLRKHLIQSHPEEYCNGNNNKLEESQQTEILLAGNHPPSSPNTLSPMSSPNSSTATTKYSIAELLSKEPKPQQPTLFQCKICAETLPTMAELSQHITLQHISKAGHHHSATTAAAVTGLLQPLLQNQPFLFPH